MTFKSKRRARPINPVIIPGQLPVVPLPILGINEGIDYQTDWARDLFLSGQWYANSGNNTTDFALDMTGKPHKFPTGSTQIRLNTGNTRSASRVGTYNVTYSPVDQPVILESGTGASLVQTLANGTGKISLDSTTAYAVLRFTGSESNFSGPGISVSILKDGDTSTGIYTDEAVASLKALGKINRTMSARQVNSDFLGLSSDGKVFTVRTAATLMRGPVRHCPMPIEYQLDACIKAEQHLWHNQSHIDDPSVVAAQANYVANNSNFPIGRAIYNEQSNETWNTGFTQTRLIKHFGVVQGLAPLSVTPATEVPESCIVNTTINGFGNSSVTVYPVPAGDKILMAINGVGYHVYQALNSMPVGTTISPVTGTNMEGTNTADGNWKLIYDGYSTNRAYLRFIGKKSALDWATWDAALVAAGRPRSIHVVGTQMGGIPGHAAGIMDYARAYGAVIDRVACAPYFGGGVGVTSIGPKNLGDFNEADNAAGPWTSVEKALATSDINAFNTAWYTAAYKAVDAAIAELVNMQTALNSYISTRGLAAGSIKLCTYEANDHGILSAWPTSAQANLSTWYAGHKRTQAYADLMTYYVGKLMSFGIEIMMFDRIGRYPTSYNTSAGAQTQTFGIQEYDGVLTPQFNAIAAFNV